MTDERPNESRRGSWFTGWQLTWLGVQFGFLVVLGVVLEVGNGDYVSVLWSDPLGVKMAASAAGLLAVWAIVYLLGCVLLNRLFTPSDSGRGPLYWLLVTVGQPLGFIVFYLPAVFTLLVGPAAVQIQQQLLRAG
jgi:hypothetical protein